MSTLQQLFSIGPSYHGSHDTSPLAEGCLKRCHNLLFSSVKLALNLMNWVVCTDRLMIIMGSVFPLKVV